MPGMSSPWRSPIPAAKSTSTRNCSSSAYCTAPTRVLVVQRRDNAHWEPPDGVLELGETFEQGVQREVVEETGITVHVDRLTGAY